MDTIKSEFISKLDSKFKNNEKSKLEKYLLPNKRGTIIPKNTLVILPFTSGEIRLKILDKDTVDKGFSIPLILNEEAINSKLSPNYLSWFLSQEFVKKYLLSFVYGSVLPRIPKKILLALLIPIPINNKQANKPLQTDFLQIQNPFRDIIDKYYEDYVINLKQKRYNTCVILAGAIVESMLYQLLIDNGVDKKFLEADRMLGFDKLIKYCQLLKYGRSMELPITYLYQLKKLRNSVIHIGLALKKNKNYSLDDLNCFDQIIKHFGI